MPSTYTTSHRFELQASGENLNTWGQRLNLALQRLDKALAGSVPIVLAGVTYVLSSSNTLDDEARSMALDVTGVAGTIRIPALTKLYWVRNGSAGDVTITTGAGAVVVLLTGDTTWVWCDGVGVYTTTFGGVGMKAYIDASIFSGLSGTFPGQAGNAGKYLQTNGATPVWTQPTLAALPDYPAALAVANGFAVAMSVVL